ncbi:MAG: hypothetical protein ACOYB4_00255 [Methyloceanibacter sp.]
MCKLAETLPIKTRLPATAWAFAGAVTLFSLVSTLMQVPAHDLVAATDIVKMLQQDKSGHMGSIKASAIH